MSKKLVALFSLILLTGCGGSDSASCSFFPFSDPTGLWVGSLTLESSDCLPDVTQGTVIQVEHNVSEICADPASGDYEVLLIDAQDRSYTQQSLSEFGGGSFVVEHSRTGGTGATITITYNNFRDDIADAKVKFRNYRTGDIICSEEYQGRVRR